QFWNFASGTSAAAGPAKQSPTASATPRADRPGPPAARVRGTFIDRGYIAATAVTVMCRIWAWNGWPVPLRVLRPLTGWPMYVAGIVTFGSLGMARPSATAQPALREPGPQLSTARQLRSAVWYWMTPPPGTTTSWV